MPPAARRTGERDFRRRLARFRDACLAMWDDVTDDPPVLGEPLPVQDKRANELRSEAHFDRLEARIRAIPEDAGDARQRWREELKAELRHASWSGLGAGAGYAEDLLADDSFETTRDFCRAARAFDPGIRTEDLFQALRNVWIVGSVQVLLGRPVALTPSVFAYSMLYPLTDNWLDDPALTADVKRRKSRRLGARLAGRALDPEDAHEADVFRLVDAFEGEFPRAAHPDVHRSLRAIHRGQVASLDQQGPLGLEQEGRLLAISVEKGGASVLTDGYLAAGGLADDAAFFCFGYGVCLQLLDDLQDARSDRDAGHATVFSVRAGETPLDRTASRAFRFLERLLEQARFESAVRYDEVRDLILKNCSLLFLGAVAENAELFGDAYRQALEERSPVRLEWIRGLRPALMERLAGAQADLSARADVESPFDLLG